MFGCRVVEEPCTLIRQVGMVALKREIFLLITPLQAGMPLNYGSCKRCEPVVPGIISDSDSGEGPDQGSCLVPPERL